MLWHPNPDVAEWPYKRVVENRALFANLFTVNTFKKAGNYSFKIFLDKGGPKNAAVAYRWLEEAARLASHGDFRFPLPELILDDYIAIKSGALETHEIRQLIASTDAKVARAVTASNLPSEMPTDRINQLVIDTYTEWWDERG